MGQLGIRLLVLLANVVVNIYLLAITRAFSIEPGYAWSIVAFNAILIFLIYAVDYTIVTTRYFNTRIKIGERVIQGHMHEE
jgi:hypothetical protein